MLTKTRVPVFEETPTEFFFSVGVAQRIPAKCPPGDAPLGILIVKNGG